MALAQGPSRLSELKAWLTHQRITHRAAAERLGISPSRMSQLLRGIYLTAEMRERIITEIGVPEYLLPPTSEYRQ